MRAILAADELEVVMRVTTDELAKTSHFVAPRATSVFWQSVLFYSSGATGDQCAEQASLSAASPRSTSLRRSCSFGSL